MTTEDQLKKYKEALKRGQEMFVSAQRHELSAILKSIRKRKKKKPEDISSAANMTLNRVESVENGDSNFTIDSLIDYLRALECVKLPHVSITIDSMASTTKIQAGKYFRRYRNSKDISLNSMSLQSKSTWRQFNYIEKGIGNYRINTLLEYLNALGLLDTVFSEIKKIK